MIRELPSAFWAWWRSHFHGLACMWKGGCSVTISKGWWPLAYGCTCGKWFWKSKRLTK